MLQNCLRYASMFRGITNEFQDQQTFLSLAESVVPTPLKSSMDLNISHSKYLLLIFDKRTRPHPICLEKIAEVNKIIYKASTF